MPMYDRQCQKCENIRLDCWEPMTAPEVLCELCGGATHRVLLPHTVNVIGDDIPGGIEIRHGICNPDGSPRRYYTKSDIRKAAAKNGMRIKDDKPDAKPNPHRVYNFSGRG